MRKPAFCCILTLFSILTITVGGGGGGGGGYQISIAYRLFSSPEPKACR